jgi:hypothetical protein
MLELIRQYAEEYKRVVLKDQIPANIDVKGAIKFYNKFKLLRSAPSWGPVPMSCRTCTCRTCFWHCICADTLRLVSLFNPKVQVPSGYIRATVCDKKICKLIGGTAGRRRMRIIKERKDDDKEVHSKGLLLAETSELPRAAAAEPFQIRSW